MPFTSVYSARQDLRRRPRGARRPVQGADQQNGGEVVGAPEPGASRRSTTASARTARRHFSMLRLSAPPAAVDEMERQQRINGGIIRFITVRVDAHEEGPSIMLQKHDREERREAPRRGAATAMAAMKSKASSRKSKRSRMSFGGGGGGGGGRGGGGTPPVHAPAQEPVRFGANAPKIDYKDVKLLQRYVSERGKIVPSRITAVSSSSSSASSPARSSARGSSAAAVRD